MMSIKNVSVQRKVYRHGMTKKWVTKELSTSYIYREIYCWVAQI